MIQKQLSFPGRTSPRLGESFFLSSREVFDLQINPAIVRSICRALYHKGQNATTISETNQREPNGLFCRG